MKNFIINQWVWIKVSYWAKLIYTFALAVLTGLLSHVWGVFYYPAVIFGMGSCLMILVGFIIGCINVFKNRGK